MKQIESFKVNHLKIMPGIYVSRRDSYNGVTVTTFDLRVTAPNREEPMCVPSIHTIEHLGATYLRNSEIGSQVVYFGPMGCRTGFYLLIFGDLNSQDVFDIVIKTCDFIIEFEGEIPGATAISCGNYKEQDLSGAKKYIKKFKQDLVNNKNFVYQE